jgi:predicted Fe-S protein YdhL (DUF1289 family)
MRVTGCGREEGMSNRDAEGPDSPCIDVCRIDAATGWCCGCLRTIQEITRWTSFSEEQRRAVLADLVNRKV